MRKARVLWLFVFVTMLLTGSVVFGAASKARTLNLPDGMTQADVDDDDKPDVTARVARISFIRGDVQVRRAGNQDWEKATLNLPLVEGDEVSTSGDARLEVQFNNYAHLRLDRDAFLKISVLKDEGIAVSLSQGTMSVRITDLSKSAGYFEIDAPKTTVAIQKSGSYRIDAGRPGDADLRVGVGNGGEARVYSDNAGFTLKSGRGARVFVDGANAGEWETTDAVKFSDEFDTWAIDRDSAIAKRIQNAYYDKYYDQDIYGADDLDDYGEWVHTGTYGYVWRPYRTSISRYVDWSPYRYGHWRWVSPFGWTWVNDEPWGWATYHHGRWVYDHGYWVWAPYGYYRQNRSWWSPALVVINIISNNVCWYPLPYHHHNNNGWGGNGNHNPGGWAGNGGHGNGNGNGHGNGNGNPGGGGPVPSRTPLGIVRVPPGNNGNGGGRVTANDDIQLSADVVPATGVVAINRDDFGVRSAGVRTAPTTLATDALSRGSSDDTKITLPEYKPMGGRVPRDIDAGRPRVDESIMTKTGAAERRSDAPLDQELKSTRIYGGRKQVDTTTERVDPQPSNEAQPERRTGAVERQKPVTRTDTDTTVRQEQPTREPRPSSSEERNKPTYEKPSEQAKPRYEPRQEQPMEKPRYEPRQEPRNDQQREQPREKPRSDPPPAPRNDPPREQPREKPRNDPPPAKVEPKVERPSKDPDTEGKRDN